MTEADSSPRARAGPASAWLLAVGLLAAGCGDTGSSADGGTPVADRSVPVIAVPVMLRPERDRIETVGTSRALQSAEIRPETAGEVAQVNFTGGEAVRAGQVLVALDDRDETLALELAEVTLADARVLYGRYERARGADAVTPTTLDAARTAMESARIGVARARVALDRRVVRAPFDGVVGLTDVEPGDRVDETTLVTTLDDRSALLVAFDVPEAHVSRFQIGELVEVQAWTVDRTHASGSVTEVDSRIDPLGRSFRVRARVDNADDALRPGMSFRVRLDLAGSVWPAVPEVAVQWGASGPYVWAVREGRAERVDARVIQRTEGMVLIDADLSQGDRVVAEGVQRMREGVRVEVLDAEGLAQDARAVLSAPVPAGGR